MFNFLNRGGFEDPRSSFPRKKIVDGGKAILLTGRYCDVDWDNIPAAISAAILAILIVYFGNRIGWQIFNLNVIVVVAILWATAGVPVYAFFYLFYRKKLDIKIDASAVQIGSKRYLRENISEFRGEPHRKEQEEEDRNRKKPRYRDALEVVMQYGENRVVIAQMWLKDKPRAEALIARLRRSCEEVEARATDSSSSSSTALQPGRDSFGPVPDIR